MVGETVRTRAVARAKYFHLGRELRKSRSSMMMYAATNSVIDGVMVLKETNGSEAQNAANFSAIIRPLAPAVKRKVESCGTRLRKNIAIIPKGKAHRQRKGEMIRVLIGLRGDMRLK